MLLYCIVQFAGTSAQLMQRGCSAVPAALQPWSSRRINGIASLPIPYTKYNLQYILAPSYYSTQHIHPGTVVNTSIPERYFLCRTRDTMPAGMITSLPPSLVSLKQILNGPLRRRSPLSARMHNSYAATHNSAGVGASAFDVPTNQDTATVAGVTARGEFEPCCRRHDCNITRRDSSQRQLAPERDPRN